MCMNLLIEFDLCSGIGDNSTAEENFKFISTGLPSFL